MTRAMVVIQQSTENMEYVRKLLKQKQPGFAAALELAVDLVERDLRSGKMPRDISTSAHPGPVTHCRTTSPVCRGPGNMLGRAEWPPIAGFARPIRIDRAPSSC